jgi:pyruvate/2-oxoacid:ferredoxin oxidoreductase beta subunit
MLLALEIAGKGMIAVRPMDDMEVITTTYPQTASELPWMYVVIENEAADRNSVPALLGQRLFVKLVPKIVIIEGVAVTPDIGLQSFFGAHVGGHEYF